MGYDCCEYLLHQIAFYKDSIRPCCSFSIDPFHSDFSDVFKGEINLIEEYLKKRSNYINAFIQGDKPPCFDKCTIFDKDNDNDSNFKLNNLIISNRTKCSCNCIYCELFGYGNEEIRKKLNKQESYDIRPILEYLRKNNYINEMCRMIICGGECTEYPKGELEYLLYFAMMTNCELLILSSGIKYSKAIEMALKVPNTVLKISVDSGTQKAFEAIKQVKAYETVWNNIQKYSHIVQKTQNSRIDLKYIIVPGINDNIEEINAFLSKCEKVNCRDILVDVEHRFVQENRNNDEVKSHISELVNHFFKSFMKNKAFKTMIFEGVEDDWLLSLLDDKYNYTKRPLK